MTARPASQYTVDYLSAQLEYVQIQLIDKEAECKSLKHSLGLVLHHWDNVIERKTAHLGLAIKNLKELRDKLNSSKKAEE